jgi:hypothetical protein
LAAAAAAVIALQRDLGRHDQRVGILGLALYRALPALRGTAASTHSRTRSCSSAAGQQGFGDAELHGR